VAYIAKVDHRVVGDGKLGPLVKAIRDLYFDVVRGKVAKYKQWCTPVFAEEKAAV
jgi:branched-chain amino acid aminotransferase